jgi:hypothetical protein
VLCFPEVLDNLGNGRDTVVEVSEIEEFIVTVNDEFSVVHGLGDEQWNDSVGDVVSTVDIGEPEDAGIETVTVLI